MSRISTVLMSAALFWFPMMAFADTPGVANDHQKKSGKDENVLSSLEKFPEKGPLFPFIDLNRITGIDLSGNRLYFESKQGVSIYDTVSKQWTYATKPEVDAIPVKGTPWGEYFQNQGEYYQLEKLLPGWVPRDTYTSVIYADSLSDPKWVLTGLADEGGVTSEQDLVDIQNKKVYRFPFEEIRTFYIADNMLWLGSSFGVISVNRETGERTDYVTYPAYRSIDATYETPEQIYYIAGDYGAFGVEKASGTVRPVEAINRAAEQSGVRLLAMAAYDGRLAAIGCSMDKSGRYLSRKSKVSLYVFRESLGFLGTFTAEVPYADTLYDAGNFLIGYGARTEGYEGGDQAAFGGAFLFDKKTRAVKVLFSCPVVDVSADKDVVRLKSMTVAGQSIWVRDVAFSAKTQEISINTESHHTTEQGVSVVDVMARTESCYNEMIPPGKKSAAVVSSDEGEYDRWHSQYEGFMAKKSNGIDIGTLKKIKVRFLTIPIPKGKVSISSF